MPSSVYVRVVLTSGSVATTAAPMFVFNVVFSAIERVALSPENDGDSFTSKTLIVTLMLSLPPCPSDTVTVTE